MNKIEVRQTSIVINDYTFGDCKILESKFRFWDEVYFREYYKGIKYDAIERKLYIPRSFDLHTLESYFGCVPYISNTCDEYERNPDILMKYMPRDDDQKEAMRFLLDLKEYSHLKNASQKMLALNTGKGKTFVAISTLAFTMIKGIILAPLSDWIEQWKNCILEYTDIKANEICIIKGSPSIARILNGKDISRYKVYLASHGTIKSYGDKYGWDKITELFKIIKVGYKIYDEAHSFFDTITEIDYATNTYRTIYLTATPGRSDEKENAVYQEYMKSVPAIDLFHPDSDPRTQYIAFKFNARLTGKEENKCINKYGFNKNNYCNILIHKENFHYMMHIVIDFIKRVNGKTLIYVATNDAILFIQNWIVNNYPEYAGNIGIYTSINQDKKDAKDKFIILSTSKSAGAAVDIAGLKMTIQLAEPMKSKITSRQSLGRTRDQHTIFLDIVDIGTPATRSYYSQKLALFNKYATKCTEVSFKDEDLKAKAEELQSARIPKPLVVPFRPIQETVKPFVHRYIINPFIHL